MKKIMYSFRDNNVPVIMKDNEISEHLMDILDIKKTNLKEESDNMIFAYEEGIKKEIADLD